MKKIIIFLIIILAFWLRFFKLGEIPPSLYWDETSLGYNSYLVANSLHDEHGELLPLARFIAFGDYKPPGYIYAAVSSVWLLGLNEFSIRLPSMIAGILMVVFTYLLVRELFKSEKIAILSSFLLSISPWAIQFSRAAFEANLAALFNLLGIYFFLLSRRKKFTLVFSVIFFILSFYTFNANRIIAPLTIFGLSLIYFKNLWANKKWLIISAVAGVVLILPSLSYFSGRESKLRFQEVSIFNNLEPIKLSNQRIETDQNSIFSKIIHNRRVLFAIDFLRHYFDNFTFRFLFTHGDVNPRLNPGRMGHLYVFELPFLFFGIYWLIKKREKGGLILLLWMIIATIPAGTAKETPHALRVLSILPTYQIIVGYGIYQLGIIIKRKFFANSSTSGESIYAGHPRCVLTAHRFLLFSLCFLLSVNIYYYLHNYYIHYLVNWSGEWQYGYKQMVQYILNIEKDYDRIFVTPALGRPYIYFAFYKPYTFDEFQKEKDISRDWFGFWSVNALGKIKFNFLGLKEAVGKVLVIAAPNEFPNGFRILTSIKNLAGNDEFIIGEKI